MRLRFFSIFLLVLALTSGAMALLHLTKKDLSALFGEPARAKGGLLFEFQPVKVKAVRIESKEETRDYQEARGQWLLEAKPSPDRADYRVLEALLAFSSQLVVLEVFPASRDNKKAMGLAPAQSQLELKDESGEEIAVFSLGSKGAWHQFIPAPDAYSKAQNWSSIYVLPEDSDYIYLCSSPFLEDILINGFKEHRDLRPFFFPPELLAEVTIVRPNGKLVLARRNPAASWHIDKPFQLEADSEAVQELVGGLYHLTAKEATNKPAPPSGESAMTLSLRFFALDGSVQEQAVSLSLRQPSATDSSTYYGRLDDWRQDIEFVIPRSSQGNLLGIDELPLSIDRLRGASLSGLDLRQLKSLYIRTPELSGPLKIEIGKSPISGEWRALRSYQGETTAANELTFFTVKKALTEEKAIATLSDSVEDLSQYGLEDPVLSLTLELFDGVQETIRFGEKMSVDGIPRYFFQRNDAATVMEVAPNTFYKLAARPFLWRDARVWNFDIVDLNLLLLERPGNEPLTLDYSDLTQSWSARFGNRDVTSLLNENRANRYLENLESLSADRWLGPDHRAALNALQNPVFTVTALFQRPDDNTATIRTSKLKIARVSSGKRSPFYYGQIEGDPHTFLLDLTTVGKLAESLLEVEN